MFTKIALALLVLLVGAVLVSAMWHGVRTTSRGDWTDWIVDVQMACQPGSDEATVVRMLGKPPQVQKPEDIVGNTALRPTIAEVKSSERVLVYPCPRPLLNGFWRAFIFIDSNGKVLAYRFAYT